MAVNDPMPWQMTVDHLRRLLSDVPGDVVVALVVRPPGIGDPTLTMTVNLAMEYRGGPIVELVPLSSAGTPAAPPAKASGEFGVVVRKTRWEALGIERADVLRCLEVTEPLSENAEIASFGPSFGWEAAAEFTRRLVALGLQDFDDFFVLQADTPPWAALFIGLGVPPEGVDPR